MKTPEPTLHDVVQIMGSIHTRMDGMDARLGNMEHDLGELKGTVLDMREDLTSALTAIDKDAETLINHEQRIVKLESN
jgi:hypothetical protein